MTGKEPPPPPPKFMQALRTLPKFMFTWEHSYKSILHKTVDTGLRVLFVDITFAKLRGLPTSEKSCQFNTRSITFTTTSLLSSRTAVLSVMYHRKFPESAGTSCTRVAARWLVATNLQKIPYTQRTCNVLNWARVV